MADSATNHNNEYRKVITTCIYWIAIAKRPQLTTKRIKYKVLFQENLTRNFKTLEKNWNKFWLTPKSPKPYVFLSGTHSTVKLFSDSDETIFQTQKIWTQLQEQLETGKHKESCCFSARNDSSFPPWSGELWLNTQKTYNGFKVRITLHLPSSVLHSLFFLPWGFSSQRSSW